ncbi:putative ankyrin repeat-containing domain-containing protein [Rosa chinensis]|uniref:Putative ankyrin repeat-containing domain-containing protein n=1 Tax=Rosa chinensis TaxID=74649 RepID=A0A2P6RLK8_ROSCH|nr:ankyrin repeat domain-containing protein, chloroplastic isoform X2 [Rosa chinensis]PRQ47305.1 putative ankyrin repeat-containing domain-containing protein [Rosa chinensis]
MSLSSALNPQTSKLFSLLPTPSLSFTPHKLSPPTTLKFSSKLHTLSPSFNSSHSTLEEDHVIGDCVVFEEGVFDDPYLQNDTEIEHFNPEKPRPRKRVEIETENLVPEKWKEVQATVNITKKERRKIAQELEFGSRVEKNKRGLEPIRNLNLEEYKAYREAKLNQLKPLVLDRPGKFKEEDEECEGGDGFVSDRVAPKNPRWAVYGKGLEDVTEFFNSGHYEPGVKKSEGPRPLFTKEEKLMLNRRKPDIAAATSSKWLPLHTLAASGEYYLMDALLKHEADINAVDKDDWTVLHKAIIGKNQAITNYLLRESANPFVRDKDGATLMHYAVRTASSQAIKILLLYNVDINLQDNDGWTPLHLAVQGRRTDVVRLLLIKGADKTLKNKDGLTPLELCLYSGRDTRTYELIKLLKLLPKTR